jgi:hypothetical protein
VLVIRHGCTLNTKLYRKPTLTGRYLSFLSNHAPHVKRGVSQSLYHKATVILQKQLVRSEVLVTVKHYLQLKACQIGFINYFINKPKRYILLKKEVQPLCFISVPDMRCASWKFKGIANRYNTNTVFKMRHTLRSSLMRTRSISDSEKTANCIYCISCECGRNYIEFTGRHWEVGLWEHSRNLEVGHLERSKLAHHLFKENRRALWE